MTKDWDLKGDTKWLSFSDLMYSLFFILAANQIIEYKSMRIN